MLFSDKIGPVIKSIPNSIRNLFGQHTHTKGCRLLHLCLLSSKNLTLHKDGVNTEDYPSHYKDWQLPDASASEQQFFVPTFLCTTLDIHATPEQ